MSYSPPVLPGLSRQIGRYDPISHSLLTADLILGSRFVTAFDTARKLFVVLPEGKGARREYRWAIPWGEGDGIPGMSAPEAGRPGISLAAVVQ